MGLHKNIQKVLQASQLLEIFRGQIPNYLNVFLGFLMLQDPSIHLHSIEHSGEKNH